jgi:hypothetical protein
VSNQADPTKRQRLDSWKEIADHLGRDVRTVIRWEHERGLPVHRVPGGKRGSVFAFADEVDRWLNHGPGPDAAVDAGHGGDSRAWNGVLRRLASGRAALVASLVVATTAVLTVMLRGRTPRIAPASVAFEGRTLVVKDAGGNRLWSDDLGMPLGSTAPEHALRLARIADVDGDGAEEVLVSVPFFRQFSQVPHELRCYSADGRLRWKSQLDDELRFRAGRYGAPWQATSAFPYGPAIGVYRVDGQARIAWAQNHHTWWPSVLSVLDGNGRRVARFVHAGNIYAVATLERAGETLLLAGGVSNSRAAAYVAVLDGRNPSGSSPEEPGSPYECLDCPPGRPQRYFTLAPSEMVGAVGGAYNQIYRIVVLPDGFEAWTSETGAEVWL